MSNVLTETDDRLNSAYGTKSITELQSIVPSLKLAVVDHPDENLLEISSKLGNIKFPICVSAQ